MPSLLLLEDDLLLGETLYDELEEAGYHVCWVKNSTQAAEAAWRERFDLYLFDVNVPGQNGFSLLRDLRAAQDETPALFLTAKSSLGDLQEGFEAGADDYLCKPFDMAVLLIRLRAKLRRKEELIIAPNVRLICAAQQLECAQKSINLPKREFMILHYYAQRIGHIIGKEALCNALFDGDYISDATFRVYIKKLNAHLEGHARLINVRGEGYRLEPL
ncbi:MAG: response regulator transcription factor [Campylobacterales bacterium]|nr:response regulator transcription factor [Campylobacterales bacterium]